MSCRIWNCWTIMLLVALFTSSIAGTAQTRFRLASLGGLGGTQTTAYGINNLGWVTGGGSLPGDQSEHAILWQGGSVTDLGTLGGPNSSAGFPLKNDVGFIQGFSQIQASDPLGEQWAYDCLELLSGVTPCQDLTRISRGFVWQHNVMTGLPTLGGNNAFAYGANDLGQIAGVAETSVRDASCTPPQILDEEAVVWTLSHGHWSPQELPPYPGDKAGAAVAINALGQVVGASGACAPISPSIAAHALLWDNGTLVSIGSLGGNFGNVPNAINNSGQVVGMSDLKGDKKTHAFLWQSGQVISDLGTLPGDFLSIAYSINDSGQIVGTSCDVKSNCRAFLWQNGKMYDLNALVSSTSSLYLVSANDINDYGEIVGQAFDESGAQLPAFIATPDGENSMSDVQALPLVQLPANIRQRLQQQHGFRGFGPWLVGNTARGTEQSAQPAATSTISVTVSPVSAKARYDKTQTFYATVVNDANNLGVSWSMHTPCDFGPACHGLRTTISLFGALHQAPDSAAGNPITIIATSNADPTVYATASVTIPVAVRDSTLRRDSF
jgi:probable HAF family extracellular repeat protein